MWSGASVVSPEKSSTVLLAIPLMRAAAYGEWCGWCKWMQPMKKPVHGVLWCSQLLKKNLGVPLESGLCMYVCSLKIKTVRGLLHAAVKTSRGGVFLLVRGPYGSAGCPSIRALGFQVSIQSGNMRCLFLSKWVQIFVSLY